MTQWGTFIIGNSKAASATKAIAAIRERPTLWSVWPKAQLEVRRDALHKLICIQVIGFESGEEQWKWVADNLALGGELAKATRSAVHVVLSTDGAAHQEWVVAFAPNGEKKWEGKAGSEDLLDKEQTPFSRASSDLGVSLKQWLEPHSGLPKSDPKGPIEETVSLVDAAAPAPQSSPPGELIPVTVEVPVQVSVDAKQLAASWAPASLDVGKLSSRSALFARVPKLPMVGARQPVQIQLGSNHWAELQAEATRLNLDPGRLLTAAFLMAAPAPG